MCMWNWNSLSGKACLKRVWSIKKKYRFTTAIEFQSWFLSRTPAASPLSRQADTGSTDTARARGRARSGSAASGPGPTAGLPSSRTTAKCSISGTTIITERRTKKGKEENDEMLTWMRCKKSVMNSNTTISNRLRCKSPFNIFYNTRRCRVLQTGPVEVKLIHLHTNTNIILWE